MSKPFSISFGKSKTSSAPQSKCKPLKPSVGPLSKAPRSALRNESDDEDDAPPRQENIAGFTGNGAILVNPTPVKEDLVIKNAGNGDWRRRGRGRGQNQMPDSQAQKTTDKIENGSLAERDEVSQASGLQYAGNQEPQSNGVKVTDVMDVAQADLSPPVKPLTDDDRALQRLLGKDGPSVSETVITSNGNIRPQPYDETEDFRLDVASRPDGPTLDEYAAMPVEEFGLAMLRGMGQKRRANGEIINYNTEQQANGNATQPKQTRQGYLGIGAKAAPSAETELGAWGKTAMRKNNKGEGFYTPIMLRNKQTGETITEEELERRKRAAEKGKRNDGEEDWRDRRDRNLERSGRDKQKYLTNGDVDEYTQQMSSFSRHSSSGRDRDGYASENSARRDRSRSRSRDRRKHRDDDRQRDRRKDGYRDDARYTSSSSKRKGQRDRSRERYEGDGKSRDGG